MTKNYSDFEMYSKDQAYWERNQLVCALSKVFPAWLEKNHYPGVDPEWENVVFIDLPTGQASWHINTDEMGVFEHLSFIPGDSWDGHSTEEKYKRLASIPNRSF
jgi:hypothetical protein